MENVHQLANQLSEHGTPEQVTDLYAAFIEAQAEFPPIPKEKTGREGNINYKYAPLAAMTTLLKPVLKKHGLAVLHPFSGEANTITMILCHSSGGRLVSTIAFNPPADIKQIGGHSTYFARYAYQRLLGIDGETDAYAHSIGETASRTANTSSQQKPQSGSAPTDWKAPFGPSKGTPLQELSDEQLNYFRTYFDRRVEEIKDPSHPKHQFFELTKKDKATVDGEYARRSKDPLQGMEQPYEESQMSKDQQLEQDTAFLNKAIDEHLTKIGFTSPMMAAAYCRRTLGKERSEATYEELLSLEASARMDLGQEGAA